MTKDPITIERRGRIACVHFTGAGRANALALDTMEALAETAQSLAREPELCAVILTGQPDRFSLGFDLADAQRCKALPLAQRREALSVGARMCRAWEELEPLTIAAIEGWCVGGGVALAVACDLRIGSTTSRYYVPELERGLNMSWGSLPRLVNLLGPARAKRLVLLAQQLSAEQASAWGLIDEVAEAGTAASAAFAQAERAASMPPVQLRMCKTGINAYANALAQATSALDLDQFLLAQLSEDHDEALASFFDKRPPAYRGR